MQKDTKKPFRDRARQGNRTRKPLRLDAETLRVMNGGSRHPELDSPPTVLCRPSQSPTLCF